MPKVFDTFPFWNEFDMLELRMAALHGTIHLHVAVAAEVTHSGNPNPYLAQYRSTEWVGSWVESLFLYVTKMREEHSGEGIAATRRREMRQRNGIVEALQRMSVLERYRLNPEDIILVSDADEIPNPDLVRHLAEHGLEEGQIVVCRQRMCYYDLNTTQGYIWQGTRAVRWDDLLALSAHVVRYGLGQHDQHYPKYIVGQPGGWHLSYFGGPERVREKMTNFLHQELVTDENTQQDTIAQRIAAGADIWGRDGHDWQVERTRDVPPPVLGNPERWRHLWRTGYEPEDE